MECHSYLDSLINYERIPQVDYKLAIKLDRMKGFLNSIRNPQRDFRSIHIAGTKGKGSVCSMIYYVLKEKGLKVGLYTSPHLTDWRERIRISPQLNDDDLITENELCDIIEELVPEIEGFNNTSKFGPLTFFEVFTAIAFLYFAKNKVDIAVLETGLGGRCDATNTVDAIVAAITPISFDHTKLLGSTLKEIALQKAGIIKENYLVVTSPQDPEAMGILENVCKEKNARLYKQGVDIKVNYNAQGQKSQTISVSGIFGAYQNIRLPLIGRHQAQNAATAIGALELLRDHGIFISDYDIRKGLSNVSWQGRLEVIQQDTAILLDGAHNPASMTALVETVRDIFSYKNCIVILGVSIDKDAKVIAEIISKISSCIIVTKADNPRATPPDALFKILQNFHNNVVEKHDIKEALDYAKALASRDDLIVVAGSLFLVGEARRILLNNENYSFR